MKRGFQVMTVLVVLPALLVGCSVKSLMPTATLVSSTPTPAPTPLPTTPPVDQSSINSFDNGAGNCVDAANEAISLITATSNASFGGSAFNTDMHLDLEPHGPSSGCSGTGAGLRHYLQLVVTSATLNVWPLDSLWLNAGPAIRQQWLVDVLNTLLSRYSHAQVSIQVIYNGVQCGSATIGPGVARQIYPAC